MAVERAAPVAPEAPLFPLTAVGLAVALAADEPVLPVLVALDWEVASPV